MLTNIIRQRIRGWTSWGSRGNVTFTVTKITLPRLVARGSVTESDDLEGIMRGITRGVAAATLTVGLTAAAAGCGGGEQRETFTILQYETTSTAQYQAWQYAVELFEEKHPDVEVEFSSSSFDAIRSNARILLTGDDVPDVMLFNTGNADGGQLAAQGLIDPLTQIVEERGLDDLVTGSVRSLAVYDENGHAGSGDWYGVPNVASYFTFFYNADMLAEKGFDSPPKSMDELEAIFDAFLEDDITPVSSNAGQHAVLQTWWQLISGVAEREEIEDFMFLRGDPDLTGGAFREGTEKLEEWLEAGYLGSQLSGVDGDQMERAFIAGEFPFMANGTWAFTRINEEADFDWGTFTFPESNMNAGASGHLWGVPANAEAKELAYDWIEITLSPEVQNRIAELGGLPVAGDTDSIEDERMREMNQQFDEIQEGGGLSYYPDYPVPGLLDFQMSGLQGMTSGTTDSDAYLESLQEFYDAGSGSL
ncbi:ABC transporter substrate-binding protein [Nesterenkonia sp. K-15-9-6]|uniref:ABC transporter substrate-binding protein n=1 Tax=Nesterenkonia sp. K-15-9-6 TaxID=3093918 RepID=UPI004045025E